MLSFLYPLSFVVCLIALSGWFYKREDENSAALFRKVFFGAIALFLISWIFSNGTFSYKLLSLGRELLILAIVPAALSLFRKAGWLYVIVLALAIIALKFIYFQTLTSTFPQQETVSDSTLSNSGEFLVEILEGHSISEVQSVVDKYGLIASLAFSPKDKGITDPDDYYLIDVPQEKLSKLEEIKRALDKTKAVEWIEFNEEITVVPIESQRPTPIINRKYGINDPGLENLWGFDAMKVDELYGILKNIPPKKKALIAILDTGVDAKHEDLAQNFKSTQAKYDTDKAGHGTHCAGIAGAVSNNNVGIASFSQDNNYVQITSIKVLGDGGFGSQKMIIDGIIEAADLNADVISMSLGGPSNDSRQKTYQKAVEYANSKGTIVVVAAGNSNRNAKGFAPASAPGVITVAAVDTIIGRASFSNFVQDIEMAVAAPGVKIYSTFPGSQYQTMNGTSMATPYVSGLVGLMKSIKPELTTKEVWKILNNSGSKTKNTRETGNLIQPANAILALTK
jgi:thermitase